VLINRGVRPCSLRHAIEVFAKHARALEVEHRARKTLIETGAQGPASCGIWSECVPSGLQLGVIVPEHRHEAAAAL